MLHKILINNTQSAGFIFFQNSDRRCKRNLCNKIFKSNTLFLRVCILLPQSNQGVLRVWILLPQSNQGCYYKNLHIIISK